jgi:Cu-Zn family superoxide dismutase
MNVRGDTKPVGCVLGALLLCCSGAASAETGRALIEPTIEPSPLKGTATLKDTPEGLRVEVQVVGAPEGPHGLHIHQYGSCKDEGREAGDHFNPDVVPHGDASKGGLGRAHPGGLGNLEAYHADGSGSTSVVLPGVTLSGGRYAVAGRAIVLHEKPDDLGQPSGNAGERIGCGSILITPD